MLKTKKEKLHKERLLQIAENLADIIYYESCELKFKPIKNLGLGSWMSIAKLASELKSEVENIGFECLVPKIHEIILYGSLATEQEYPEDIDLMIIDNGHFSEYFHAHPYDDLDAYLELSENLELLMDLWFRISEEKLSEEILEGTGIKVDLHVLSINLITSLDYRKKISAEHNDPDFFRNAFHRSMRFNPALRKFEPLALEYLEKMYRCCLDDIKIF